MDLRNSALAGGAGQGINLLGADGPHCPPAPSPWSQPPLSLVLIPAPRPEALVEPHGVSDIPSPWDHPVVAQILMPDSSPLFSILLLLGTISDDGDQVPG